MRRFLVLAVFVSLMAPGVSRPSTPNSSAEFPVSFSVRNTNTTRTAPFCKPDGKRYTVRGTLAAPTSDIADGPNDAVTLYAHGSGDGYDWNLRGFPGVDHIGGMAELGHTSVFIHMIGYGTSDAADGRDICYGSFADVARQVVQHLRQGSYVVQGGTPIRFERVALAGHSGGAVEAELYAVSYHDIDAVVIAGWADAAPAFVPLFTKLARFGITCQGESRSKKPGGPKGWARIFSKGDLYRLLYNVDDDVLAAFAKLYEDDACGILRDSGPLLASSFALSPVVVKIPVLLIYGDHEPFTPGAFEIQRAHYASSPDVSLAIMPNAGHNAMHGRTASEYRAVMSGWLKARGF